VAVAARWIVSGYVSSSMTIGEEHDVLVVKAIPVVSAAVHPHDSMVA
jgi:hypothetical protein